MSMRAWVVHTPGPIDSGPLTRALTDLLAYRDDMVAQRRAVLDQMSRDADELGLYE